MDERKCFHIALTAVFLLVAYLIIKPFLNPILLAIILAYTTKPIHTRLAPRTGVNISAALTVTVTILIIVIPLTLTSMVVIEDARDVITEIEDQETINFQSLQDQIKHYTGQDIDIEQTIRNSIKNILTLIYGNISAAIDRVIKLVIGVTTLIFLQFYLLKDGQTLTTWTLDLAPLPANVKTNLLEDTTMITTAVTRGHILVAIIQGLVAAIGLLITGIPNLFFWTFIMLLFSIIPFIGSIGVWGPASIYLLASNKIPHGAFLLTYGLIIVGLTDNILRPLLVDTNSEMHPTVLLLGILGGVYTLGVPGIFYGPVFLGVLKSLMKTYKMHRETQSDNKESTE